MWGETVRYAILDTTPIYNPAWAGVLNTNNPTILNQTRRVRTPDNLFMDGKIVDEGLGTVSVGIHGGKAEALPISGLLAPARRPIALCPAHMTLAHFYLRLLQEALTRHGKSANQITGRACKRLCS